MTLTKIQTASGGHTFSKIDVMVNRSMLPQEHKPVKTPLSTEVLMGTLAGTALGTLTAMYFIAKGQTRRGIFSNPKKIFSNMFSIKYNPVNMIGLGLGAVAGGLAGGLLTDKKENGKAKVKEAIHQSIGNIILPLLLVKAGFMGLNKFNLRFPAIKGSSKTAKIANVIVGAMPETAVSLAGLGAGIHIGNKISNKVNKTVFREKDKKDRNVKFIDYCVHTDEVFDVAAFLDKSGKWKSVLGKILPFTYAICGYLPGVAREEHPRHAASQPVKHNRI